ICLKLFRKALRGWVQVRVSVSRIASLVRQIAGGIAVGSRDCSTGSQKSWEGMAAITIGGAIHQVRAESDGGRILSGKAQSVHGNWRCRKALLYDRWTDRIVRVVGVRAFRPRRQKENRSRRDPPAVSVRHLLTPSKTASTLITHGLPASSRLPIVFGPAEPNA